LTALASADKRGKKDTLTQSKPLNTFTEALEAFRTAMSFRFIALFCHSRQQKIGNLAFVKV
jgi:hypothetical protein